MIFALFSGLFAASPAAVVHVEETADVALDEALFVARELARAIERRTGRSVPVDETPPGSCAAVKPCLTAMRARAATDEVIVLRLLAGARNIRLVAERWDAADREHVFRGTLPKDRAGWAPVIAELAAELYPQVSAPAAVAVAAAPRPAPEKRVGLAPWLLFGGSAVALGAGVGFGLSSSGARDDLSSFAFGGEEHDRLRSRASTHAIAADVLFVAAAAGVAAGVYWLLSD